MVPLRSSPIKLPDNLYIAFSYIVHYPDHGERAAYTGLQPTPASWLRGTYPHLLHSCEAFSTCFSWHNLTPPYVPFGIRRFLFWAPFEIAVHELHIACLTQFKMCIRDSSYRGQRSFRHPHPDRQNGCCPWRRIRRPVPTRRFPALSVLREVTSHTAGRKFHVSSFSAHIPYIIYKRYQDIINGMYNREATQKPVEWEL